MNKKKLLAMLCAGTMLIGTTACSSEPPAESGDSSSTEQAQNSSTGASGDTVTFGITAPMARTA